MNPVKRPRPVSLTRQHQADATRSRLLDLGWEMVRQEGISLFTMRGLALKAGVAVGLPYAYFQTREGLIDELRIRAWERLDAEMRSRFGEPPPDPEDARERETLVRSMLGAIVEDALAEPHLFELLSIIPGTEMSEKVLARELQCALKFGSVLASGVERGHFHIDDLFVFALSLWTAVHGHVQRMSGGVAPWYREVQSRVLDQVLDVFLAAARRGTPGPSPVTTE